MVEAAEADVVGPAVAADDPDALADEVAGQRQQVLRVGARGAVHRGQPFAEPGDAVALEADLDLRLLAAVQQLPHEVGSHGRRKARQQDACVVGLGVERQAHAEAELGVVLEQRVVPGRARGPGR